MEDRQLPITVGQGAGARIVTLTLPPFTMIGATTRAGLLTTPLRDRFGVTLRLELYEPEELGRIVTRSAAILETEIDSAGAETIASRSRGTPRVANRLLKRVRDYAEVRGRGVIDAATAAEALRAARGRRGGPGPPGPRRAAGAVREVRRRSGGAVHAGDLGGGGARHDRGRAGALPAALGLPHAHPAGTRGHRPRLGAAGPRDGPAAGCSSSRRATSPTLRRSVPNFICPNCGERSLGTERTAGFQNRPKACKRCGFGFLFELLDDYYPAPNAAFFVCDQQGRLIGTGRGVRELTGLGDLDVIGRDAREVLGLRVRERRRPHLDRAGVGRADARQDGGRARRRRPPRACEGRHLSRLRRRRRAALVLTPQ